MKKAVIISDSHGNLNAVRKLYPIFEENDIIVHLGDGAGDIREFYKENPEKVYLCAGNCDFFSPYPSEGTFIMDGVEIFYTHGHNYRVKSHLYALSERAKELGCKIALYGHTHTPSIDEVNGITCINPGSLRFEVGKGGSYCYLVVHGEKVTPVIVGENPQ
jgi:putative phosphoesterase